MAFVQIPEPFATFRHRGHAPATIQPNMLFPTVQNVSVLHTQIVHMVQSVYATMGGGAPTVMENAQHVCMVHVLQQAHVNVTQDIGGSFVKENVQHQ